MSIGRPPAIPRPHSAVFEPQAEATSLPRAQETPATLRIHARILIENSDESLRRSWLPTRR